MENILNPTRFGRLLTKHFQEHLRTYLMSLIVFGGVILALFISSSILSIETQSIVCVASLFIGMFIFSANIFSDYNHPRSAFTASMLPASLFEKYLLYWLVCLVGFTVLALGVYHLSQSIIIEYLKTQGVETPRFFIWKMNTFRVLLGVYLLLHSMAFLGSISFRKKTVIVTALVSFAIIAAYAYLNHRVSLITLNGNSVPFPFYPAPILTENGWAEIVQPNKELWATISLSTLTILFWICAFFKLKERQV